MFRRLTLAACAAAAAMLLAPPAAPAADDAAENGFRSIFDGKTLEGWDGNPKFWSVRDGAITGQTTDDNPTKGNTFIIWRQGEVADFELRLKFRIEGGNSGIQYRSKEADKWVIGGYQADFDSGGNFTGILYEERGRGILAHRGNKVEISPTGEIKNVGATTPEADILASYKKGEWNDYTVIAQGNHLIHKVNGLVTVDVTDHQKEKAASSGLLALQLHAGPSMIVQFKDIQLKQIGQTENKDKSSASNDAPKKVVFVAGRASHDYGSHEHYAGCVLLAKELEAAMPNIKTEVVRNGWPQDASVFNDADCVVMYADGGGGHPVIPHLQEMDKLAKQGVGVVCLHYAVEIPKGETGDRFLDWIGGYFEAHWSVNPHWTANFKKLPDHPVTRGVEPFSINDEWYYHMRFREGMEGVTPILSDVPPKETLTRPDGPHSGNPDVRKAVAQGETQHVAWAAEREDGGRGFGFTGGHFHWNWGDPNFRKVVLNAIVWCAKGEVPEEGVQVKPITLAELEKNQDEPQPASFNRDAIRQRLNLPAKIGETLQTPEKKTTETSRNVKPAFQSDVLTTRTDGHAVPVEVDLAGAKELYLVVTDGDNGFACDWADWAEPRLVSASGEEKKLTEIPWKYAGTDWGQVRVNQNAEGSPLRIAGKPVAYGIGTHANSLIAYDLPPGYVKFRARAGLDNGGTDQAGGSSTSVRFAVYTQRPPQSALRSQGGSAAGSHDPEEAVAALDVADGLEATLFSSEPEVLSLTNLDVDHRGRVWACEVVNYRLHLGKRPEGDRILILEDTDGDGRSDKTKVYYQGREVDSAMGICVLGNKVIVSATPNIWVFTDEDGDDRPDRKEALFTKTGQPQHDHSAHSFLFGPDGKLYWNFGNTGQAVHDRDGNPVVDVLGRKVIDNGQPYFGGMVFRCNLDGSEFEVLAHNFRNNYETTVDSFGTIWQSDNDDDGNRGVRINYVMEYGNYGYRDEMNGAGWQSPRTGMEEDIPTRHWHQNDPGVIPNLLQTGGGSPTGITVNEGDLLPEVFRNEVIHCDAGPNIVRAYPVEKDGAGYSAESVDVLHGARDNWFRPADVCVAPDGSLFITDWYDPGVGGHNMQDLERGRLFRVAPQGVGYRVPQFDFNTIDGCVAALKSPNASARYLAWTNLHKQGVKAEPALAKMWESEKNPRYRARALWLLGKIPGQGEKYVSQALKADDPDLRIVGIRLARQLKLDIAPIVASLVDDPSPQVRRECAVALHQSDAPQAPQLWAELASRYDGEDRWYVEALGIGAAGQWDACLAAWLTKTNNEWNTPAGRDIVWRSRSKKTPGLLAQLLSEASTPREALPRYFRAFDFQQGVEKDLALAQLAVLKASDDAERHSFVSKETLSRLKNVDLRNQAGLAKAIEEALQRTRGTSDFVSLVEQFRLEPHYPELLRLAQQHASEQLGVEAIRALLSVDQVAMIGQALTSDDLPAALATATALGNSADGRAVRLLLPIVQDSGRDLQLRREGTRGLAQTRNGAERLLAMTREQQLDEALHPAASFPLNAAPWEDIRRQAARLFPLPPPRNNEPLPPLTQLVSMKGDVARGREVFLKTGECAKCHKVGAEGKEVGPNLSEIGDKLSKPAFYESILYPSAGIAHSYETWSAVLDDGNIITGLMVSQTAEEVTLKKEDGLTVTLKPSQIEELVKQKISLMPADLQKTMTTQELVDLVEFLTTLKKG